MPSAASYEQAEAMFPLEDLCPMEAGLVGRLSDNECAHGRLPGDRSPACGCWGAER
jgi:hypothetical protein